MKGSDHIGFDNEKYLKEQTAAIIERVSRFNDNHTGFSLQIRDKVYH